MYVMFGPGAIPYGFDLYELYPGRSYPLGQSSPGQSVLILSVLLYWAFNLQMLISMPPFFFHDLKVSKIFLLFMKRNRFYTRNSNLLIPVSLQPNDVVL